MDDIEAHLARYRGLVRELERRLKGPGSADEALRDAVQCLRELHALCHGITAVIDWKFCPRHRVPVPTLGECPNCVWDRGKRRA